MDWRAICRVTLTRVITSLQNEVRLHFDIVVGIYNVVLTLAG